MTDTAVRTTERISRLGIADEDSLPPKVAQLYAAMEKQGGVPNWIKALAVHPDVLRRFLGYYEALFTPSNGVIPMLEREMIAAVVSNINGCTYCTMHHTGGMATHLESSERAQRISHNYREVDLSERERAICDFSVKVTEAPERMQDADFDALRAVGMSDEEIFEVLEVAAFFSFSNRLATPLAILPDSALFDFQRR
ncbi:putative peroxidase-related enzyme [Actinomycetospora succinea]|uniref:Putative peroxidase-related enzyme n=1 Tax=Actinomycetospora succinea TaxID=663603 RepID=A0A4R6UUJ9_9PSEU|nr:peroxidase-related enzyme [Actinomycetospora succinea]TDQ50871.1 putative peroxidase-related enzyme [Actinomycetospora succinea]